MALASGLRVNFLCIVIMLLKLIYIYITPREIATLAERLVREVSHNFFYLYFHNIITL